jgi:hypothetical protein
LRVVVLPFGLALILCLCPLPLLWVLLRWGQGRRAPAPLRVAEFASLSFILWLDFILTPILYLLPRLLLPLGHPAWSAAGMAAYLYRPVRTGGIFGTASQWWVSAIWLLLHRPEPAWAFIQVFWLCVLAPAFWATWRGGWRYGPREPAASPAATHGSSRWRQKGELARSLQRIPCDLGEEGPDHGRT